MKFGYQLNGNQQEDLETEQRNDGRMECKHDLERLEITDCKEWIRDRDYWRSVIVTVKILKVVRLRDDDADDYYNYTSLDYSSYTLCIYER